MLENLRFKKYQQAADILTKYQFPMCSNPKNKLSDTDWKEIGISEEEFLRKKIKETNTELDILFIPSTIIDLFLTNLFFFNYNFESGKFEIPNTIAVEKLSYFPALHADSKLLEPTTFSKIVSELYWNSKRDQFRTKMLDISYNIARAIKSNNEEKIWKIFFDANKIDTTYKTNFFVDSIIIDYIQQQGISINNLKDSFEKYNSFLKETVQFLSKNLQRIAKEHLFSLFEDSIKKSSASSMLKTEDDLFVKDKNIELLNKAAENEIYAHKENKYLIYRGSTPHPNYLNSLLIIDSVLKRYPYYNLSYGNSILAGRVEDPGADGAEAYFFMIEEELGYLLKISKEKNNDLFFISPLNRICSFFASGEFFHSRCKIALKDKNITLKYIYGIETHEYLMDEDDDFMQKYKELALWNVKIENLGNFLLSKIDDPYNFDSIFSKYISDNAIIIKNDSKVENNILLINQKEYSLKLDKLTQRQILEFNNIRHMTQRNLNLKVEIKKLQNKLNYEKAISKSLKARLDTSSANIERQKNNIIFLDLQIKDLIAENQKLLEENQRLKNENKLLTNQLENLTAQKPVTSFGKLLEN